MPTVNPVPTHSEATVQEVVTEVRNRHRSHLRELRVEVVESGIILHGRATSFYGKQIAFHEVRCRCRVAIVANQIVVQQRPADAAS